ncbi:ribosomal L27e protein family-domain-containing protein [Tribonema minus]|uniref:Ribosomal L27e protein family-domain-containing protein n=1 Tax=Tribonema minus TaxID=303371 RepID=A0A836CBN1_9STRA|nr:ribosomal L27e protein family-domain-containing protein [Tribonema minus]
MGIIKAGKVVIMLAGRYAGRKAIVVKAYDSGSADRKFTHALVAGIDRYPRKVTKSMSKVKVAKRSKCKPFVKFVNVNHLMPTRYTADIELKTVVEESAFKASRPEVRKAVKKVFEERYLNQGQIKSEKKASGSKYFFAKLAF